MVRAVGLGIGENGLSAATVESQWRCCFAGWLLESALHLHVNLIYAIGACPVFNSLLCRYSFLMLTSGQPSYSPNPVILCMVRIMVLGKTRQEQGLEGRIFQTLSPESRWHW